MTTPQIDNLIGRIVDNRRAARAACILNLIQRHAHRSIVISYFANIIECEQHKEIAKYIVTKLMRKWLFSRDVFEIITIVNAKAPYLL